MTKRNKTRCDICKTQNVDCKTYKKSGYGDVFYHCELCDPEGGWISNISPVLEMRRLTHIILKEVREVTKNKEIENE